MVKTEREINTIIKNFKQELKNMNIIPKRIILYGSYKDGNPREDSDIDLIVISENFKEMNLRERLEILGLFKILQQSTGFFLINPHSLLFYIKC